MIYRLMMCIAAIGLVREAVAGDIDTALGPPPSYPASYPTSVPAPSYRVHGVASSPSSPSSPVRVPSRPVADTALAADTALPVFKAPIKAPIAPAPPSWSWTGFYIGAHVGASVGSADFADPLGAPIFGDKVTTPGFLAGAQIGYNWQAPGTNWVLGVEADASWLTSDGTNTCLAFSGLFVSATCHADPNAIATLTARGGYALGPYGRTLIYAKGGAAFVHNQIDITTNATTNFVGLPSQVTGSSFTKVGWTIGAGVEHALAPGWSVNLEYDYVGLGGESVGTPPGLVQSAPGVNGFDLTPAGAAGVTQNSHEVKLGVNYKFGRDPLGGWGSAPSAFPVKAPVMVLASGWEVETGARYWHSSGRFQKDLGSTTDPAMVNILNSRLTYDSTANAGEFFGRVETPVNVFVKGNIGAGSLRGHLNDEDWAIPPGEVGPGAIAYSNTLSDPVKGHIDYATFDLGYDFFHGAGSRLGAFVGYNYYKENKSAFGCTQIANPFSDCAPAIPGSVLVITENDTWNSFRLGLNGDIMIADRLKLAADVAYLPYAAFIGTDDHVLRDLIIQESGIGTGLQLETILSYLITDQLSVGVGGRYWAMWTNRNATAVFDAAPCPCQTQPAKTERYGVFLQASYNFGPWRRVPGSGPAAGGRSRPAGVEWYPY